jgi:hypothetical protein
MSKYMRGKKCKEMERWFFEKSLHCVIGDIIGGIGY